MDFFAAPERFAPNTSRPKTAPSRADRVAARAPPCRALAGCTALLLHYNECILTIQGASPAIDASGLKQLPCRSPRPAAPRRHNGEVGNDPVGRWSGAALEPCWSRAGVVLEPEDRRGLHGEIKAGLPAFSGNFKLFLQGLERGPSIGSYRSGKWESDARLIIECARFSSREGRSVVDSPL